MFDITALHPRLLLRLPLADGPPAPLVRTLHPGQAEFFFHFVILDWVDPLLPTPLPLPPYIEVTPDPFNTLLQSLPYERHLPSHWGLQGDR